METADYQFHVPERLIPLSPPGLRGERRARARMLVLRRAEGRVEHSRFDRLGEYLRADVLVVNDALMFHDQLKGRSSRGAVTPVLFGQRAGGRHAAVRPASRAARGLVVCVGGDELRAVLVNARSKTCGSSASSTAASSTSCLSVTASATCRSTSRCESGRRRAVRNVYARRLTATSTRAPGSLEIPPAGLHFTEEMPERFARSGVTVVPITLHIGLAELQLYRHIL